MAFLDEDKIRQVVQESLDSETGKALSVAIVGQTGVGKSSLLNALFGSQLVVGDICPTTKIPEPVIVQGNSDRHIIFWDMPGFGESEMADQSYLELYRAKLLECDVVLWAVHADVRSVTYDQHILSRLLESTERAADLARKLTFVSTKADMLAPPPWIYAKRRNSGFFAPSPALAQKLAEKAEYFEEVFWSSRGRLLESRTYNNGNFAVDDDRFSVTPTHVTFQGRMTRDLCDGLSERYPEHVDVFSRLRNNHRVILCSAHFKYGLLELLSVIINKIDVLATMRFKNLLGDVDKKQQVEVSSVRLMGTIVVWDTRRDRKTFDFQDIRF